MFTACFDAAGSDHDQIFMVVAGFVAPAESWSKFDAAWRLRLDQDGLSHFHMVDFAHSKKEFKGWEKNEHRRRALLSDLMNILQTHASRKFSCTVKNKTFILNLPEEVRNEYRLTAYTLGALGCAAKLTEWRIRDKISSPLYVFEQGDLGKGKLMETFKKMYGKDPMFLPKTDIDFEGDVIPAFTPLQAADFYAYEMFEAAKTAEKGIRPDRWALEEFDRIPGEPAEYIAKNLEELKTRITAAIYRILT